jgi:predicted RNA-binding protein YlqC (UPF0109 family)
MALKDLVTTIARALVDSPDEVIVDELDADGTRVLELRVGKDDIGKVIGKDGRTAQSIRAVLAAAASKAGQRVQLDILD